MNRPNILFILSDDQGAWALGCAGNSELKTPHLDALAARGMRFENFFCASPVCSPARASLLTGRIPSQHGVHDWLRAGDTSDMELEPDGGGERIEYLAGLRGYTEDLAEAGYRCGLSGKWHLGDSHLPQKGFVTWEAHATGGGPYYGAPFVDGEGTRREKRYVTEAITDHALDFLRAGGEAAEPFYLSVHYTAPHSPWGREHHPAAYYDPYFEDCPFASTPADERAPGWVRYRNSPMDTPELRREAMAGYYASTTAMDAQIGRLIAELEAQDKLDDTLIVFTSDNGMCMGHHGLYGKGNASFPLNLFEESVKVPFIAAHPGRIPEGAVCDRLVSQYDFYPTLKEYLDLPGPNDASLPGRSFAPALTGKAAAEGEAAAAVVIFDEYGPARMIRHRDWKYVHRFPYGPHELYRLDEDPREMNNLVGEEKYREVEEDLRGELRAWFARYADPERDGALEGVTGSGQIGLCGPRGKGVEVMTHERVDHLLDDEGRA